MAYHPMPPAELFRTVAHLMVLATQTGVTAACVLLLVLDIRAFKTHWKRGLAIAIALFVLSFPHAAISLFYLDPDRLMTGRPDFPPELRGFLPVIAGVFACGLLLLLIPFRWMYYHIAAVEWARLRPDAMPLLTGQGRTPWLGLLLGAVFGLLAAVVTLLVFAWLKVRTSPEVEHIEDMFPGFRHAPVLLRAPMMALAVTIPAIVEELVFRGGLMAFFLRLVHNRGPLVWAVIAGFSAIWASLHFANTDAPATKCTQIFLLGLAFGHLARRYCLEASMAAHVALNLGAVILSLLFGID